MLQPLPERAAAAEQPAGERDRQRRALVGEELPRESAYMHHQFLHGERDERVRSEITRISDAQHDRGKRRQLGGFRVCGPLDEVRRLVDLRGREDRAGQRSNT